MSGGGGGDGQGILSEWEETHPLTFQTRRGQQLASGHTAETTPLGLLVKAPVVTLGCGEEDEGNLYEERGQQMRTAGSRSVAMCVKDVTRCRQAIKHLASPLNPWCRRRAYDVPCPFVNPSLSLSFLGSQSPVFLVPLLCASR